MPSARPRSTNPIERLYALWAIGLILTLVVIVAVTYLLTGYIARQTAAIQRLDERLIALESALAARDARPAPIERPAEPDTDNATPPATPEPPPDENAPADHKEGAAIFHDDEISGSIRAALRRGEDGLIVVADPVAADATLRAVLSKRLRAEDGATFARLAVLAAMLTDADAAEAFAQAAIERGETPLDYFEIKTRNALLRGANTEAMQAARQFDAAAPESPKARTLLAIAIARSASLADATQALGPAIDAARVPVADRLMLGQLLISLERWDQLAALNATLPQSLADESADRQRRLLLAAERVMSRRVSGREFTLESIAMLERLLDEQRSDVMARVWLARAYYEAGQFEAARSTLSVDDPALSLTPEPSYWLGRIELATDNPALAEAHFQRAVEIQAAAAPAWEALASMALNRDEIAQAIAHAEAAVRANTARASAHFLLAIAHARAGEPEPAAMALHAALALNPALLEEAENTALGELFTPEELAGLLPEPAPEDQ